MLYISYFPGDFMGNFSLVWIFFTMFMTQISTLFISDTQTFCDYFNFKSLYEILYELYFALEFANFNTQIIQLIIKPMKITR